MQHILKAARDLLEIINRELADPICRRRKSEPSLVPPISCDVLYIEDDLVNFTLVERILEFRPALKLLHARSRRDRRRTGADPSPEVDPARSQSARHAWLGSDRSRLQSDPATAQVPVVVLSADATPSQIERLLTAGARNYLTKPFDIDPFLAVVDEMVSGRRAADRTAALFQLKLRRRFEIAALIRSAVSNRRSLV